MVPSFWIDFWLMDPIMIETNNCNSYILQENYLSLMVKNIRIEAKSVNETKLIFFKWWFHVYFSFNYTSFKILRRKVGERSSFPIKISRPLLWRRMVFHTFWWILKFVSQTIIVSFLWEIPWVIKHSIELY